ncbi:MAG: hypothetical protein AAFQ20_00150 [Bacteroidota bacterium]
MKHDKIDLAKKELVQLIIKNQEASKDGNYKLVNSTSERIWKLRDNIEKEFGLEVLKDLLEHDNPDVQVSVAHWLLPIYEEVCIMLLRSIGKKKIPHTSFDARLILSEWLDEPLEFDHK